MTRNNDPINPIVCTVGAIWSKTGLSKKEYFAFEILKVLLQRGGIQSPVEVAIDVADDFISKMNDTEDTNENL